jgi:predicted short-subunit dehydrogenase-like oxidoreductase (DUF2520 family)
MPGLQPPVLGIVGGGRAAWAIASAWRSLGWPLSGVALREGSQSPIGKHLDIPLLDSEALARSSTAIALAVSDRAIEEVAKSIVRSAPEHAHTFHLSGSLPASILGRPRSFSLHPFRALPPVGEPVRLAGALLVYEGCEESFPLAHGFAHRLGARIARISAAQKPLYHAAAVLAANDVAALLDLSETILREVGLREVEQDVAALADTAIVNWLTSEGAAKFTGPVVRRDVEVLRRHREALAPDPHRAALYSLLAVEIVNAMARRGASEFDTRSLMQRVREALDLP